MYNADAAHPNDRLRAKLNHIFSLRGDKTMAGRMDLSIRPDYFTLLDRLGNPHRNLPPVIHVAGTNGKGSTIAFMRAILEASGYRVHTYTSPHLIDINERIVLNGRAIDDDALESLLDEVMDANGSMPQTFFEITTALAFAAFARAPGDVLLLETGLGGRLDSTNVVERPAATVITTLSYDHTVWLGDTLEKIAGEKAGIIKRDTPCIVGPQIMPESDAALRVIRDKAAGLNAPLYAAGAEWDIARAADSWALRAGGREFSALPAPSLTGAHQIGNAATAIAALLHQAALTIPAPAITAGLIRAAWPGRMHRVEQSPAAPAGWDVWIDGAHNDSAAMAVATQAEAWRAQDGRPLHLIAGMMGHKDAASFAAPLIPHAATVTFIPVPGDDNAGANTPENLARLWHDLGGHNAQAAHDLPHALDMIGRAHAPGRILILGSLYLAGAALRHLGG